MLCITLGNRDFVRQKNLWSCRKSMTIPDVIKIWMTSTLLLTDPDPFYQWNTHPWHSQYNHLALAGVVSFSHESYIKGHFQENEMKHISIMEEHISWMVPLSESLKEESVDMDGISVRLTQSLWIRSRWASPEIHVTQFHWLTVHGGDIFKSMCFDYLLQQSQYWSKNMVMFIAIFIWYITRLSISHFNLLQCK